MQSDTEAGFATKAIHAGQSPSQWAHRSVIPPIVLSATFQQDVPGEHKGFEYGRSGNPSRKVLETCLAAMENGKHASAFSSGLGSTTAITSLLKSGDHIICGEHVYGGTSRYFRECASNQNIETTFVDAINSNNVVDSIKPNTKMIWLETPSNPLVLVCDIKAISMAAKSVRSDIIVVVDNTFLTCYFQRPLQLGADISSYSLSKYMNGHADVIMGAAITNSDEIAKKLKLVQNGCRGVFKRGTMGIVPSPFDCAFVNRGLKTLEIRMQKHMSNGLAVAKFLESHPLVSKVLHPYLPSHPQYALSLKQATGHSGMVAFYLKADSDKFFRALKLIVLAGSLGIFISSVLSPSKISHASLPEPEKKRLGITDQLIRMSVGLETVEDIIADLDQALKAAI